MWPQETVTRKVFKHTAMGQRKINREDFPRRQSQGQRKVTLLPKHKGLILILTVQQDVMWAVCFSSVLYQMGVFLKLQLSCFFLHHHILDGSGSDIIT